MNKHRKISFDDVPLEGFQQTIENSPEGIFWLDETGQIIYVNRQAQESLGYTKSELSNMYLWDIDPDYPKHLFAEHWVAMSDGVSRSIRTMHQRKDGSRIPVEVASNAIEFGDQRFHVSFVRDISRRFQARAERERLQSLLVQSQRLEAVGSLAGGIAHDFNNLLAVIQGAVDIAMAILPENETDVRENLELIAESGERGSELIRQLLAFSRKQSFTPRELDVHDALEPMGKIAERLAGKDIQYEQSLAENLPAVLADVSQLEQVLMNLIVNARDAIHENSDRQGDGKIVLETSLQTVSEASARRQNDVAPGEYVGISVSDNGIGMSREIRARVFEPFYTTKEEGRGTGLGLATVFGIVTQNGGDLVIESEPGEGTRILVLWPTVKQQQTQTSPNDLTPDARADTAHSILMVEEDESLGNLAVKSLSDQGYRMQIAESGRDALSVLKSEPVDAVITNDVLLDMDVQALMEAALEQQPGLKFLVVSANAPTLAEVLNTRETKTLQKPYSFALLSRRLHALLNLS